MKLHSYPTHSLNVLELSKTDALALAVRLIEAVEHGERHRSLPAEEVQVVEFVCNDRRRPSLPHPPSDDSQRLRIVYDRQ